MEQNTELKRCFWVNMKNPLYIRYHDEEWGKPCHDERRLYEAFLLDMFQAGLSWECILNKREAFRAAYDGFAIDRVASYDAEKVESLMQNAGIVRNRRKIEASIKNSILIQAIQREWGSFDRYLWHFTDGEVLYESCAVYTSSPLSDQISEDLRRRGMSFVGTTMVYSYLQGIGIINEIGRAHV